MRPARSSASDAAVELFQSALLSYWNFEPKQEQLKGGLEVDESDKSDDLRKVDTTVEAPSKLCVCVQTHNADGRSIPVLFFDEAHRLPALISAQDETMKVLLDACLVLTKQDRLCHVVMATSSSHFFQWLRQLNVLQHV